MKLFFLKYLNSKDATIREEDEDCGGTGGAETDNGNRGFKDRYMTSSPSSTGSLRVCRGDINLSNITSSPNSPRLTNNASRFWDEEREENAIYSIYLKKVRYHPGCVTTIPADDQSAPSECKINGGDQSLNTSSYDNDDISHLQWETVKVKQIKAGTLEKLVENLISQNGDLEQNFATIFLATFRSFSTPAQLMASLQKRYLKILENREKQCPEKTRPNHLRALRSIFSSWLDNYLEDFCDDTDNYHLIKNLCAFAQNVMKDTELALRSLHKIDKIKMDALRIQELPIYHHTNVPTNSLTNGYHGRLTNGSNYTFHKNFDNFDVNTVAEQLTYVDSILNTLSQELFKGVIPYQCMGCFWSKKNRVYNLNTHPISPKSPAVDKGDPSKSLSDVFQDEVDNYEIQKTLTPKTMSCSTVRATVDFFNLVSFRVMDTILSHNCYLEDHGNHKTTECPHHDKLKNIHNGCGPPDFSGHLETPSKKDKGRSAALKSSKIKGTDRAKRVVKWIEIARELRMLKNFSSLKAVISALRSNPIYRLTKIWGLVPKDKLALFEELSALCSEDNNQSNHRILLEKEGTAKMVDPAFPGQGKRLRKQILRYKRSHSDMGTINGTVPYLGTFLTDLTMLDTMYPDYVTNPALTPNAPAPPTGPDLIPGSDPRASGSEKSIDPHTTSPKLINFEKRRKEFDVMIQIKILQSSATNYSITPCTEFWSWFKDCPHYTTNINLGVSCDDTRTTTRDTDKFYDDFDDRLSNLSLNIGNGSSATASSIDTKTNDNVRRSRQTLSHYEKMAYASSLKIQPLPTANVHSPCHDNGPTAVAAAKATFLSPGLARPLKYRQQSSPNGGNTCSRDRRDASMGSMILLDNPAYYGGLESRDTASAPPSPPAQNSSPLANNGNYRHSPKIILTSREPSNGSGRKNDSRSTINYVPNGYYNPFLTEKMATKTGNGVRTTACDNDNNPVRNNTTPTTTCDDSGIDSLNNFYDVENGGPGLLSYNSSSRSSFKCNSSFGSKDDYSSGLSQTLPASATSAYTNQAYADSSTAITTSSTTLYSSESSINCSRTNVSPYKSPDHCIIKVSLDKSIDNSLSTNMYKSIWIKNSDKTGQVLAKSLEKHGMSEDVKNFSLYQIRTKLTQVADKTGVSSPNHSDLFLLPDDANVFYGMRDDREPTFKIVRKDPKMASRNSRDQEAGNKFNVSPQSLAYHKYSSSIKKMFPNTSPSSYFKSYHHNLQHPGVVDVPKCQGYQSVKSYDEVTNGSGFSGCTKKISGTMPQNQRADPVPKSSMVRGSTDPKVMKCTQKKWKSTGLLDASV